jgi:Lon-like protease
VSVVQVAPDTPAASTLEPGDIITAVDGNAVTDEATLREAIASATAGEPLTLDVLRRAEAVQVQVTPTLIDGAPRLGVVPETVNPRVSLPVPVDVTTGPVGGPSAGLIIALTVYDSILPDVDLAGGRIIAGTGTIDENGIVGPIGGAGLKVIAAHRRGASIFLSPRANLAAAQAALPAGSAMQIVGVDTFDEARDALLDDQGDQQQAEATGEGCPYDR